jgi:sec-independent protein translocase protein TatA
MPSWIGPWEIAIVLVLALLIFGPRKLPELGSSLGKSIRGFKRGMKDGQDEEQSTVSETHEAAEPKATEPLKAESQQAASESVKSETTEKTG